MKLRLLNRICTALLCVSALLVAGCGWVDSAGGSGSSGSGGGITLDEQPIGGAVAVLELSTPRVLVAAQDSADPIVFRFENTPLEQGALDVCLALDGFDAERAASDLADACSADETNCEFVAEVDNANADELAFFLRVPELRAPIGRRHVLTTGRETVGIDGEVEFVLESTQEINFCLIAINEAPDARDDTYVLVAGDTLDVGADEGVLTNDTDDDDVGNQALSVVGDAINGPSLADVFELREDGGFSYEFADTQIVADVLDSFIYTISDGSQTSMAEVTVRIVAANQAPVLLQEPETIMATVGEELDVDLSVFFEDPEGLDLEFRFDEDLPDDGTLALSNDGVLSGVPGENDEGEFVLTLIADDGELDVEAVVTLVIDPAPNLPPEFVAGSVFSQTIDLGDRIETVRPEFIDPEGGNLTYESVGADLPTGVILRSATGLVVGRPRRTGTTTGLIIQATDPEGNTAESDPFFIRVL